MEKSNQLPKTEDCLAKGEPVGLWCYRVERLSRSVSLPRQIRTGGGCSGGAGEARRLTQRQAISAALSGGCLQFARVGDIAGI
jgi:hypothetical protein